MAEKDCLNNSMKPVQSIAYEKTRKVTDFPNSTVRILCFTNLLGSKVLQFLQIKW